MVNVASQRKEETSKHEDAELPVPGQDAVANSDGASSNSGEPLFEMTTNFQPASPSMIRQNADDFQRQIASSNVTSPSTATLPPKVLQVSCFLRRMNGRDAAGTHKTPRFQLSNTNVQKLKALRNDLSHHPSRSLKVEEYNIKVDKFRSIVKGLEVDEEEIEKTIRMAGVTDSIAAKKIMKARYEEAKQCIEKNEGAKGFERALKCFDKAISTPSLLRTQQASAFEKREQSVTSSLLGIRRITRFPNGSI
ncbi:unnamed protein product [Orchesella dallaii]|uniref:Uncharacterized protein n=1 Tax=Orchesella dallaii TaxID=48710 RepID=A0ABP1RRY7_9HEXA